MPTTPLRHLAALCALAALALAIIRPATAAPMTLDDRIACQTAIDEVRWSNMLWPESNPTPKPPLSEVLPPEKVREKVLDQLRMEAALDGLYAERIGHRELQAELDRMARQTRAPDQLRELYAALGNEAARVADCLARPQLVREKLQSRFAFDPAIHADTRDRARRHELKAVGADAAAIEREVVYVLADGHDARKAVTDDPIALEFPLAANAWNARLDELRHKSGKSGHASERGLRETRLELVQEQLQRVEVDRFVVKLSSWPKRDFGTWWRQQADAWAAVPRHADKALTLTSITQSAGAKTSVTAGPDDTWWTEDFIPTSRFEHVAVWSGVEMIVWGGFSAGEAELASGGRYSPATDTWLPMSAVGASNVSGVGLKAVWANDQMIVWNSGESTGARYRPDDDAWTALPSVGSPKTFGGESVVWTGKFFIVWGGEEPEPGDDFVATGARYDPDLDNWSSTSPANAPSPRFNHIAVAAGPNMIVWGGQGPSGFLNDGRIYDPNKNTWSSMSPVNAPSKRTDAKAVWTGSEMIVWGGQNDFLTFKTGARYNPSVGDFGSWQALPLEGAPQERYDFSLVWANDRAVIWGGMDIFGVPLAPAAAYVPSVNQWLEVEPDGAPSARYFHSAIWDGTHMIVWGGNPCSAIEGCTRATSDGARYDPVVNGWSPMKDASYSPRERVGHASVWTGEQLQVWGGVRSLSGAAEAGVFTPATASWSNPNCGYSGSGRLHTVVWSGLESLVWGGVGINTQSMANLNFRYAPIADTCAAIEANGVTPRYGHTAVWLGGEMIVWGGRNTDADYPPGGMRYRPEINSWLLMSGSGAPSPRYGHTAVVAGNEMLIWGGLNGAAYLGNGGRYSLSDNEWMADLPSALAPEGRAFHTAVWTGTKMIVWGGVTSGLIPTDDGAAYSLADNKWSYVTNDSAPSPRFMHTAVWTGRDMLVWGGSDGDPTNTGGRYRVSEGLWLPMSTANAPAARLGHTAVWTGEEMFVWGGQDTNEHPLAGLGSYSADGPDVTLFSDSFE